MGLGIEAVFELSQESIEILCTAEPCGAATTVCCVGSGVVWRDYDGVLGRQLETSHSVRVESRPSLQWVAG